MLDRMERRVDALEAQATRQTNTIAMQGETIRVQGAKIELLTDRVATLTTGVRVLSAQVIEMGGEPRWKSDVTGADAVSAPGGND